MLPTGHTSAAYLITQLPIDKKTVLKWYEVVFILICSNLPDIDFFVPNLLGYPSGIHHYVGTHTPLFVIGYFLILYIFFKKIFSRKTFILVAVVMAVHLVLDDLSYWLYLVGLEESVRPQIFWLFPFDPRFIYERDLVLKSYNENPWNSIDVFNMHIFEKPRLFYLEIGLTVSALVVFIKNWLKNRRIIKL